MEINMINYKYSTGWAERVENWGATPHTEGNAATFTALQHLFTQNATPNQSVIDFTQTIIQFIVNNFDADNTLRGLFRLIKYAHEHRISPFLATHDYCVKVLSAEQDGQLIMNISPIYLLGPEYPDYYEQKQGKKLNTDAIIGLVESSSNDPEEPSMFNLGIDAGIAFPQATISHNKRMSLDIKLIDEGVLANIHCDGQTTSKIFTWEHLGMPSASYTDLYREKIQNIWAA
ncbi:MAG: hypothetical protein COB66_03820 [Coxiella sp. (in: Bacteria)]|nr:MAG: hypothetical protein COB66_03820 [Coxiella sp. (in: g-proteobacteria)]